ncbi:LysM peptidoglycan-binding domain-containing protein [Aeoliella sp. ICT_H6.2]|uniref:LysM peptidoglycan-binding domain-containing protein n=1 Tax=Aeoliella straminimaris TaxID=2954799 RepID=A0A9X2FG10_9BACT|nr:LysM peptidoglycan-binding domain-containing protein [Aeoliella straminimaris]
MSEITKLLAAAGLISAGFFGASMFGSPDSGGTSTGAPGDWTPQRLVPLQSDTTAVAVPQLPSNWDENVAPASHNDGNQFALGAGGPVTNSAPREHSVARQTWPNSDANGAAPVGLPEIRRTPTGASVATSAAASDPQAPSLTPPPLFETPTHASPLRRATFPPRMSTENAPAVSTPPPATDTGPSITLPDFETRSDWPNNWGASNEVRSMAPLGSNPPEDNGELVWHVVKDGDRLPDIAQRYLGDPQRAREIYELNQDRLENPDLLPIGVELRIPQRRTSPSVISVFDSHGPAAQQYAPQSRLVPLPELPESVQRAPRARLQPPVSASLVNAP